MPEVQPVQPEAAPAAAAPEAIVPAPAAPGQGGEDANSGLYSLDAIPEGIRDQVAPIFKEWDGNVTRKFQQNAEQWKPYDELGIRDIDPEEMAHLVTFHQLASDPDAFKDWVASAHGELFSGEDAGGAPEAPAGEGAPEGAPQYLTQEDFDRKLEEREAAREAEREQQTLHDSIAREARETLDSVLGKVVPADAPTEKKQEVEDLVCFLAQKHQSPDGSVADALKAGFADYQKLIGGAKSDALDEKLVQPKPAENGGRAASEPTAASSFDEAGARLKERLNAANAA
jgi:hypothetical protein